MRSDLSTSRAHTQSHRHVCFPRLHRYRLGYSLLVRLRNHRDQRNARTGADGYFCDVWIGNSCRQCSWDVNRWSRRGEWRVSEPENTADSVIDGPISSSCSWHCPWYSPYSGSSLYPRIAPIRPIPVWTGSADCSSLRRFVSSLSA